MEREGKLMDVAIIPGDGDKRREEEEKKSKKKRSHSRLVSICFWTIKFQSDSMDLLPLFLSLFHYTKRELDEWIEGKTFFSSFLSCSFLTHSESKKRKSK